MMIERAVGIPATRWVEEQLLRAFHAEHPVILGTDRSGYFHGAAGVVRMTLIDWIRFAIYVDQQRRGILALVASFGTWAPPRFVRRA